MNQAEITAIILARIMNTWPGMELVWIFVFSLMSRFIMMDFNSADFRAIRLITISLTACFAMKLAITPIKVTLTSLICDAILQ